MNVTIFQPLILTTLFVPSLVLKLGELDHYFYFKYVVYDENKK